MWIGGLRRVGGVQITSADVARVILRSAAATEPKLSALTRGPAAALQQPQYAQFEQSAKQPTSGCSEGALTARVMADCVATIPPFAD